MKSKILLVDDEAENLKLLRAVLQDDYALFFAKDGFGALTLAAHQPDLILLDIMMPEMDGYEVCQRLKRDEQTKDIPVIFVTAKRQIADEISGFEMGAVDYITKPISPPVVKARVKTHLALRTAYQEVKRQNIALIEADNFKQEVELITRHDLKSPINGVIGFSDVLLKDKTLSSDQKKYLTIIRECGFKSLHMINLSLGLFQMGQGTYQFEPVPFDLLPVIRDVQTDLRSLLRAKKLTFIMLLQDKVACETDSFFVRAEKMLCYSMLANLIKNALEASPDGLTITLSITEAEEVGIVRIHNQGAVAEEIRERFFEKYTTAGKKSGTGLGTYSAKLIAETMGGKIQMQTSTEKGTDIVVSIPKGETSQPRL